MAWTNIKRLADAVKNDILGGLRGYHSNLSISSEQLEQDIVDTRLAVIKEYMINGILPVQDLLMSINCIPVDCSDLAKCGCNTGESTPTAHFQIPQILFDYGLNKAIYYIGSIDKRQSFNVYTKPLDNASTLQKYRKRGKNKPWVYIDVTPNQEGLLDCYIFNAPLIKQVSVIAIFKDPRQLEEFQCNCGENKSDATQMDTNLNFIDQVIKEKVTKEKLYYYRQLSPPIKNNDQQYI